jgi:hypothetical protein
LYKKDFNYYYLYDSYAINAQPHPGSAVKIGGFTSPLHMKRGDKVFRHKDDEGVR